MNIRCLVKSIAVAALVLVGVFYNQGAYAEDINGFYKWAEEVVEDVYINKDGTKVAVFVTLKWKEEAPSAYYSWIPSYIVCTRFTEELSRVRGIDSFFVLFDTDVVGRDLEQDMFAAGWMPSHGCPYILEKIQKTIDHQEE